MEQKLALAAFAFEAGSDLVLVVSDGDPLYVSETGTSPSSLLYGTNRSFVGTVDQVGVVPNVDRFTGILITEAATNDESLVVSDATPGWGEAGLSTRTVFMPRSAPNYDFRWAGGPGDLQPVDILGNPTRIIRDDTLPGGGEAVETRGKIRVIQPDNTESSWSFTNWNQRTGSNNSLFNNQDIKIIDGPGYGGQASQYNKSASVFASLPGNYYYPTAIKAIRFPNSAVGFEVTWDRPLPSRAEPRLVLENYLRQDKAVESTNETINAASNADNGNVDISFTLREASGRGVVPGALRGELFLPARNVTAEFFATATGTQGNYEIHFVNQPQNDLNLVGSPATLVFSGTTDLRQFGHPEEEIGSLVKRIGYIQVTGSYDDRTGVLNFAFASGRYGDDDPGNFRQAADVIGEVSVGEVQLRNVRYAVYDQNLGAATKSVVELTAGLTVSQGLTVDMLTPGAAVVLNSPISTAGIPGEFVSGGPGGGKSFVPFASPGQYAIVEPGTLALRASSVTLNADIDAESRIDIGYTTERAAGVSAIDNQQTSAALGNLRPALAIPEINDQKIANISPVVGHRGSGYVNPPKVVVEKPQASKAKVSVSGFVGGLTGITLTGSGEGYQTADGKSPNGKVDLIISAPDTLGLDSNGDLAEYEIPAKQAAGFATFVDGKIESITMTSFGFGYSTPPSVALPAPTRRRTVPGSTTNPPQTELDPANKQATVSFTYGGVITRLSIDEPGYNYAEQDQDLETVVVSEESKKSFDEYSKDRPKEDPAAFIYIQGYGDATKSGDPTIALIVRPLVGANRDFLRIDLPHGGIRGDFDITDPDPGRPVGNVPASKFPFTATADPAGNVTYSFKLDVAPPPQELTAAKRPVVRARLNPASQINDYQVVEAGNGYGGNVPQVFVVPPVQAESVGIVEATISGGAVEKLLPAAPDVVFDVAYNVDSFLDGDGPGTADSDVANLRIPFEEDLRSYTSSQVNELNPKDSADAQNTSAGNIGEDESVTLETRLAVVLQRVNGTTAEDVLEIPYDNIQAAAYIFEQELVGIQSIDLSVLEEQLNAGQRYKFREDFGKEYRLVVRTTYTATKIGRDGGKSAYVGKLTAPNGELVVFEEKDNSVDGKSSSKALDLTVGKAYLATGYGYAAAPTVTVQRANAASDPAEFHPVLDREGRVVKFSRDAGGENYDPNKLPQVNVTGVDARPVVEHVAFNSSIRTDVYDIRVADAAETADRLAEIYISPVTKIGNGASPASEFFLQVDSGRVYVEGEINATQQSYLMQSPGYRELDGPFVLTTKGRDTGAVSGLLQGDTVTVLLGNETTETDPLETIVAHTLDVDTEITSLRVTAGESRTAGVFPYEISIRERSEIAIDAVVGSSQSINIDARGEVSLNASVNTVGDFSLTGGGRVDLNGPIVSERGVISLEATNVNINAPVRVIESRRVINDDDAIEPSIVVTASAGNINIAGAITSPDGVALRQRDVVTPQGGSIFTAVNTSTDDKGNTTTSPDLKLTILDRQVVSQTVNVPQLVPWDRINVSLDITHTWVGDLTGTLVSPAGERFVLFSNVGGSSDNLDNITFDSSEGRPISVATPPLRGVYSPRDPVQPRFGIVGTWRLEIYDAYSGDQGRLNRFSIQFVSGDGAAGSTVVGSVAGRGVVEASRITIDADGTIGSATGGRNGLLAVRADRVDARSTGAAVGLRSDRASQFIVETPADLALYVSATDVLDKAGRDVAALRAEVIGAATVAVEAPRGSVDVDIESPNPVLLRSIEGSGGANAQAAGFVSITMSGADLVVADAPRGGESSESVKAVLDLGDFTAGSYRLVGDAEGEAAGVLRGTGLLGSGLRSGDRVLVVDSQVPGPADGAQPFGLGFVGLPILVTVGGSSAFVKDGTTGRPIDLRSYAPWVPVAGGEFDGQRELVLANGSGDLAVWSLSPANEWSGFERVYRRGEPGVYDLEHRYGRDLNGDGLPGDAPTTPGSLVVAFWESVTLETRESQTPESPLVTDANGRPIDLRSYAPWAPVAGGEFNGQRELVWKNLSGDLAVWSLSPANVWSGFQRVYRRGEQGVYDLEFKYGRDLDDDGGIGFEVVENRGSAHLEIRAGDQVFVNGMPVLSGGRPVYNNAQGWSATAAEVVDGVNLMIWQRSTGDTVQSVLWQLDGNWRRTGAKPVPADAETLARYEAALGVDINGDQIIGELLPFLDGLRGESIFIGDGGVLYIADQPLKRNSVTIRSGHYTGWQVVAARFTADGKPASVLWKHTSGRLAEWLLDDAANYVSDGEIPSQPDQLEDFQDAYGVSLPSAGFSSLVPVATFTSPPSRVRESFGNNPAIGVYDVVSVGGVGAEWIMVRSESLNTSAELADRTYVTAADSGNVYRVDRLAGRLGQSDARVVEVEPRETKLTVDPGNSLQYVVTSTAGAGSVSGSLGRILSIVEANRFDAIAPNVVFGMDVGAIALSQQLPAITKPVVLDGYLRWDAAAVRVAEIFPTKNNGVAVFGRLDDSGNTVYLPTVTAVALDGSRITLDRSGAPISAFSAENIDGLVFENVVGSGNLAPSEARPAGVRNLVVGGFTRGAGIAVRQSSNVLLESLETGAAEVSGRRGNRTGIEIAGSDNVTVKDTTITGNSVGLDVGDLYTGDFGDEGVVVSDGVVVVGGVVQDNQVGIRLGSQGRARIGALPIPGTVGLRLQRGTTLVDMRSAEFSSNLTLPEFFARLYVGMPIGGTGVAAGTFVSAFDAVAQEIVLSRPIAESSPAQRRTAVVFGRTSAEARENSVAGAAGASSADGNVISGNTTGVELLDGAHQIVGTTILNSAAAGVWIGGARNVAGTAGHHVGVAGALAGRFENVITGNNGFGVLVRDSAAPMVSIRENMFAVAGSIAGDNVPGNLGIRALQSGVMRNRAFSGLSDEYVPATGTGIDSRGNFHSPADESSVRPPDPPVVNAFIGGVVTTTTPLISGTGAAGGVITIYIDGQPLSQTAEVAANGGWSLRPTVPLATGRRSIAATVKNSGGQTSVMSNTVEVDVQLDTTPPDTAGLAITTQQLTSTSPSIVGTAQEIGAILELEIRNSSWSSPVPATYRTLVGSDGTWRVDTASPLSAGTLGTFVHQSTYAVTVRLIDAVGNRSEPVAKSLVYSDPPPPPEPPRRPTTRF